MEELKSLIDQSLAFLSKKWTVNILLDLMDGRKRFSELLNSNESISNKVLADRLKELVEDNFIQKIVINMIPLTATYQLTEQGRRLNRILFELAVSAVIHDKPPGSISTKVNQFAKLLQLDEYLIGRITQYLLNLEAQQADNPSINLDQTQE
ncbi:MAG: winged helix-turn-helix transcriptional regulator [Candidatus Kariarchaeaceae archaeon]